MPGLDTDCLPVNTQFWWERQDMGLAGHDDDLQRPKQRRWFAFYFGRFSSTNSLRATSIMMRTVHGGNCSKRDKDR